MTMTMEPLTLPQMPGESIDAQQVISQRTMCLVLELKKWGIRRKVKAAEQQDVIRAEGVEAKLLHHSKDLLVSPELDEIGRLDGEITRYVGDMQLPAPLRHGLHMVPVGLVNDVFLKLEEYSALRVERVDAFLAAYPGQIIDARDRLGRLFNSQQYPGYEEMADKFRMEFHWQPTVSMPNNLRQISRTLFHREQERVQRECQTLVSEVKQGLRDQFHGMVSHLQSCLTPGPDGKLKRFEATSVENLRAFIEMFEQMDINGDTDTAAIAGRARALLNGTNGNAIDADQLRRNSSIRETTRESLNEIAGLLQPLVRKGPSRRLQLED
jgi:hypothetical protein